MQLPKVSSFFGLSLKLGTTIIFCLSSVYYGFLVLTNMKINPGMFITNIVTLAIVGVFSFFSSLAVLNRDFNFSLISSCIWLPITIVAYYIFADLMDYRRIKIGSRYLLVPNNDPIKTLSVFSNSIENKFTSDKALDEHYVPPVQYNRIKVFDDSYNPFFALQFLQLRDTRFDILPQYKNLTQRDFVEEATDLSALLLECNKKRKNGYFFNDTEIKACDHALLTERADEIQNSQSSLDKSETQPELKKAKKKKSKRNKYKRKLNQSHLTADDEAETPNAPPSSSDEGEGEGEKEKESKIEKSSSIESESAYEGIQRELREQKFERTRELLLFVTIIYSICNFYGAFVLIAYLTNRCLPVDELESLMGNTPMFEPIVVESTVSDESSAS